MDMDDSTKIMTLHPGGKLGVNILKRRYEVIKDFILEVLQTENELSFKELVEKAVKDLSDVFDGSVMWYVVTVKQDLEARQILENVPKVKPQKIRLKLTN
jgi:hypothetical protein